MDLILMAVTIKALLEAKQAASSRLIQETPEFLRQIRAEQGWIQAQLAELLGVGQSFIAMVEAGQREMSDDLLQKLLTIMEDTMEENEVKISREDGKAHCPICGQPGEYREDGQTCEESEWVWENGRLVAVPAREGEDE